MGVESTIPLIHITEVGILLIRHILKGMNHLVIPGLADTSSGQSVPLLVFAH